MTTKQLSDELLKLQIRLYAKEEKRGLSLHDEMLLQVVNRNMFLLVEDGILNMRSRLEVLLAIKGVLLTDIKNHKKRDRVSEAIAFVWHSVKSITSQEFVAECFGVDQSTICTYYKRNFKKLVA